MSETTEAPAGSPPPPGMALVPVGELAAFGLAMEQAQEALRLSAAENAELRAAVEEMPRPLAAGQEKAIRDAALEQFGGIIRDATGAALAPRLAGIEDAARNAERERIRQLAIECSAVTVSATGRMQPFEELLRHSPEENAAMLLKVAEDGAPS